MFDSLRRMARTAIWVAFKLPLTLVLICVGMLFEFLLFLPFALLCRLDGRARHG